MKKSIWSLIIAAILLISLGNPASANEHPDTLKALEMIEKTNIEIDEKIEKAVEKADELQSEFLQEVREIEEGKKVLDLKEERQKVKSELQESTHDLKKQEALEEKISKINAKLVEVQEKTDEKMAKLQAELATLTTSMMTAEEKDVKKIEKKILKLTEKMDTKSAEYQEKTQKYTTELDGVISDIYNETLKMSAETIAKAAEKGVQAECSWKLVRFADRWVWIDPIRVVGR